MNVRDYKNFHTIISHISKMTFERYSQSKATTHLINVIVKRNCRYYSISVAVYLSFFCYCLCMPDVFIQMRKCLTVFSLQKFICFPTASALYMTNQDIFFPLFFRKHKKGSSET